MYLVGRIILEMFFSDGAFFFVHRPILNSSSSIFVSGTIVGIDVRRGLDEEGRAREDQGRGNGRLHYAHHRFRLFDHICHHGSYPRPSTGDNRRIVSSVHKLLTVRVGWLPAGFALFHSRYESKTHMTHPDGQRVEFNLSHFIYR